MQSKRGNLQDTLVRTHFHMIFFTVQSNIVHQIRTDVVLP